MVRNNFNIGRRITIGLKIELGAVDHGRLETASGTDSISFNGRFGVGGGLRVGTLLLENAGSADWFGEFSVLPSPRIPNVPT